MLLRPYQLQALTDLRAALQHSRRVCLVSPTGSGKTVIAGTMIDGVLRKGRRAVFLAHRKELLDQPAELLAEMGHRFGMVRGADRRADPEAPLQIASIQTLARRNHDTWPRADLVFLDECHRARAATYEKVLAHYSDAAVVGLSATPQRLDGKGLGNVFGTLVQVAQKAELIEQGWLVPSRVYAPTVPDLRGVKTRAGDWAAEDVARLMDEPRIVGDVVEHWKRLAAGRLTLGFAASVEHAHTLANAFRMAGVAAAALDDKTGEVCRRNLLADLASGRLRVLWNYGILVEGVDIPQVSCISLCRPTKSLTVYLQACGRGDRLHYSKTDNLILDHGGCSLWHGLPTVDRVWSLDTDTKREAAQCRVCPWCFAVVRLGVPRCPECKRELPVLERKPRQVRTVDGKLQELEQSVVACRCGGTVRQVFRRGFRIKLQCDRCREASWETDPDVAAASVEQRRAEWAKLEKTRVKRNYAPGWSAWRYKALFGNWPSREVMG
jgi:superfamily II DNA or RNA helicase